MDSHNAPWRFLYPLLASLAGALAALSFQTWKDMSPIQIVLFLIAGTGFGYFVFPLVFRGLESDPQLAGGACFLMASAWNILLPLMIKKLTAEGVK